jgi:hypothetical protein
MTPSAGSPIRPAEHAPGARPAALADAPTRASDDHAATSAAKPLAPTPAHAVDVTAAQVPVGLTQTDPAKTMTVVTKASHVFEGSGSVPGAKLRDALVSVANHAVLRAPATGQIDVPELGRVAVRAHAFGGAVDIDVTADKAGARATLRGHANAMTADLHQADVPVARLTIDRSDPRAGHSLGSSPSFRDRDANAHDSPRDNPQPQEHDTDDSPTDTGVPRRVRIVL